MDINVSHINPLPNLIVIGAGKCGTTSLHYYLSLHPQICMSREKELNFFIDTLNWDKGIHWYKNNFDASFQIRGETSPRYTQYPFLQGVPERMFAVVPDAKIIYILRDPIDRIISEYVEHCASGTENATLESVINSGDRVASHHCPIVGINTNRIPGIYLKTKKEKHCRNVFFRFNRYILYEICN